MSLVISQKAFNEREKFVCLYKDNTNRYVLRIVTENDIGRTTTSRRTYQYNWWDENGCGSGQFVFPSMIKCVVKEEEGIMEELKIEFAEYLI